METIGLNLIESALLGNKILASNLEYVNEVVLPSICFNPNDPLEIAMKVEYTLNNDIPFPKQIIEDKINKLISCVFEFLKILLNIHSSKVLQIIARNNG